MDKRKNLYWTKEKVLYFAFHTIREMWIKDIDHPLNQEWLKEYLLDHILALMPLLVLYPILGLFFLLLLEGGRVDLKSVRIHLMAADVVHGGHE